LIAVKFEYAVVYTQVSGFAAATGADDRRDFVGVDIQVVVKQSLAAPVEEVEITG